MLDCERPSLERQLLSNQIWETFAFIAKAAFMLGLTPWMIRSWGAQGYGEFALASSTFVLLSLVDLGIRAKTRLALCSAGEKDRAKWPSIVAHSAATFAAIGALTIGVAFVLTFAGVWQNLFHISLANRNLLFITTMMSILVMLSGLLLEPLVAIGRIGKLKLATAIGWLAAIPTVAFVLSAKGSVIAALVSWLGCLLGANLFVLFRNRSVFDGASGFRPQLGLSKLVATLKEAFWFNICNATWTLKTYGTTLLISALNGPASAGFFFILLRLSEIISALGAISSDVSLGELAQAATVKERRRSFWSSYSWAVVLCSHIALVIGFCARDFFRVWLHLPASISIFVGAAVAALGLSSALNRTVSYAAMGLGIVKSAAKCGAIEAIAFLSVVAALPHSFDLVNRLAIATISTCALVPLMQTVSRKLESSLIATWLHPIRLAAPFMGASASVLLIANVSENPIAKVFAMIICASIGLLNICSQAGRPPAFAQITAANSWLKIDVLNVLIRLCLKLRFLRIVLDRLNIRGLANTWLRRFPVTRVLPDSGIRYRMRSTDSLLVAREIFAQRAYQELLPLNHIASFADLGSNCGFFTCFLMDALNRKDLSGLTIDANPRMVEESKWHIGINGFDSVHAIWGMVGAERSLEMNPFFLHPDDAGSSRFAQLPAGRVTHNRWQRIEVPSISLAAAWRTHFGDLRCDLLKIDIEGSEASLIENEADFLRSVGIIVMEIHHWLVDVRSLEQTLDLLGYERSKVLSVEEDADVRLYFNSARRSSPSVAQNVGTHSAFRPQIDAESPVT